MFVTVETAKNLRLVDRHIKDLIRAREQFGEIPIVKGVIKVPTIKETGLEFNDYEELSEKTFPGLVAAKIVGETCIDPKPILVFHRSKPVKLDNLERIGTTIGLTRNDLATLIKNKTCKLCKQDVSEDKIVIKNALPIEAHLLPNLERQDGWGLVILYYKEKLLHKPCNSEIGHMISRKRLHYFNDPMAFTKKYWIKRFPKIKLFGTIYKDADVASCKGPLIALNESPLWKSR
jgi:hypothetical protein